MDAERFLDPAKYAPSAVDAARTGDIAMLGVNLLLIRLMLALQQDDLSSGAAVLDALKTKELVGYPLFQVATAAMVLSARHNDELAFHAALEAWLAGRRQYPENWSADVLQDPRFAKWLASVDPKRLEVPVIEWAELTDTDRAMVKDLPAARLQAVTDNFEWLAALAPARSIAAMAESYDLAAVDVQVGEATLVSRDDLPALIVTLSDNGEYSRSFVFH